MSLLNLSDFMTVGIISKKHQPVFKIKNIYSGEEFALKKIQRFDFNDHLQDFAQLTKIISCCSYPNIMKIIGFSMTQNKIDLRSQYTLCIMMELYKSNLEEEIIKRYSSNDFFSKSQFLHYFQTLFKAFFNLQSECKIAHRDIKPSNILLDINGDLFISDFGECFQKSEFKSKTKTMVGTPEFMSPEMKKIYLGDIDINEYDPWVSDTYSFGITLLNIGSLSPAELNITVKEKLEKIECIYGKHVREILNFFLEENWEKRGDFINLETNEDLRKILNLEFKHFLLKGEFQNISVIVESENVSNSDELSDLEDHFGRKISGIFDVEKNGDLLPEILSDKYKSSFQNENDSIKKNKKDKGNKLSEEMKFILEKLKEKDNFQKYKEKLKEILVKIKEMETENRAIKKATLFRSTNKFQSLSNIKDLKLLENESRDSLHKSRKSLNISYNLFKT